MANPQPDKFTKIANELLEQVPKFKLSGAQFRIILVIWRYTYGFKRKNTLLSISYITEATGLFKRHVERELSDLIKRNIVTVKTEAIGRRSRILGFNKDYETWKTTLAPSNQVAQIDMFSTVEIDGSDPSKKTVQEARSTVQKDDQERKVLKKDIKEKTVLFESFFSEYPRKVSKKKAQESWNKLCKLDDFDPDEAISNTINYAQTCILLKTETRYILHPSTYLNQRRYEDYPKVDPEGLAKGKDKLGDNLDFLREQLEGSHEQGRGQLTDGKGDGSLPE